MKVLATHNDLDGCAPIVLSKYFALDFDDYVILDYNFERTNNQLKEQLLSYDEIYFTDFCPTKEFLIDLLKMNKKVWIFDHHDTSSWVKEISNTNLKVYHDITICGTLIFYRNYIKPLFKRISSVVYYFVSLVNVYDTWKINDSLWDEAQNLNRVLYKTINWDLDQQHVYDSFIKTIIDKLDNLSEWRWSSYEYRLIQQDIEKEARILRESEEILQKRVDDRGKIFGLFKASSKISIVCSKLLAKYVDLDYVICINTFKLDEFKLSCRSLGFDCTQLDIFSGHKEAAGGALSSIEEIDKFWNGEMYSLRYKNDN